MRKYRKSVESEKGEERIGQSDLLSPDENSLFSVPGEHGKELASSRRDFLKFCGFSFAVSALSSCRSKIGKAIPYVIAPEELTPGEALYYASSYINGNNYCSILVKTRDGRPVKIEGNPASSITNGGTTARVQASVLDLYDTERYRGPLKNGVPLTWEEADAEIITKLKRINEEKGRIVILTPSVFSPSTETVINNFREKFRGTEWIRYDAVSASAILEANKISFGKQVIPDYRFDRSDLIVSFGADFLGTWLSPAEYTKQFSSRRDPEKEMCHLVQLESILSLTGSNADQRIPVKPSDEYPVLLNLYKLILKSVENRDIEVPDCPLDIRELAGKMLAHKGKSLVISGSNVRDVQLVVNEINRVLGNIDNTILFESYLKTYSAVDNDMELLVRRMQLGSINGLIVWNTNPAYTWYNRAGFQKGLERVGLTISLSGAPDETAKLFGYVCPDNHYLESWNDAEPKNGCFSLMQPVISPIFDTRQMADSLLKWAGSEETFYDFIKVYWSNKIMPLQSEYSDPVAFFDNCLQKGVFEPSLSSVQKEKYTGKPVTPVTVIPSLQTEINTVKGFVEIIFYESVAVGDGRHANNPWLQELPDPVTRICWDNFASFSPSQANELKLAEGDIINIRGTDLPVHIQPGQAAGTVGIALGYGRTECGKVGTGVGSDVWPMLSFRNGNIVYTMELDDMIRTKEKHTLAQTQTHHSMEGRAFVREASLTEFKKDNAAGNELHAYFATEAKSLYKERVYPHHHWGMAIDLSRCTGCGNCVIACQAENNVPVVGKNEVHRVHEMHWLRIDRYYTGDDANPEVVFQPVLCQHCQNAPCENVCPVAATNHSSEGLNQMIYNRCFGTRYCNNNCPYKVRRFNWFNYTESGTLSANLRDAAGMTTDLRRMVLNPDVTVRSQGVIEKCSFCIQRIQAAKLKAKSENRALNRNEVKSACSQSCPANAIVFGDLNDTEGDLSRLIKSGRRYMLLEELFTKPSVNYLTKIKNRII